MNGQPSSPANGWAARRVLVTGATGFVGSWLVKALVQQGAFVCAFVRPVAANDEAKTEFPKGVQVVAGDVTDLKFLSQLVADLKLDTVFHLAASNVNTGAGISPYDVFETNLRGVYTVLEAARLSPKPVGVVIASSKEVEDCFTPDSRRKFHPYMTSKASAELVTRAYADTFGIAAAILRSQNIYGGGDFNWNRLVPGIIKSISQGETPVIRGDGSVKRDCLYVEDAIAAYLALGLRLENPEVKGKLFRIATGSSTGVLEIVCELMRAAGIKNPAPKILNQKTDSRIDVPYQPEFERTTLGWQSRHSLAQGVALTWEWYRNYFSENPGAHAALP